MIRTRLNLTVNNMPDLEASFFIDPMPAVPRKDDRVEVSSIIERSPIVLEGKLHELVPCLGWDVTAVFWDKDRDGYFVDLYLEGNNNKPSL